jgi:hypothetical protein
MYKTVAAGRMEWQGVCGDRFLRYFTNIAEFPCGIGVKMHAWKMIQRGIHRGKICSAE